MTGFDIPTSPVILPVYRLGFAAGVTYFHLHFCGLSGSEHFVGYGDVIGVIGFLLYLCNYILITFQHIDSRSIRFFVLNTLAAACVLFSLSEDFNLAAAMIQIFWIVLGIVAITVRLVPVWRYRTTRPSPRDASEKAL